jgi:putative hemolysin
VKKLANGGGDASLSTTEHCRVVSLCASRDWTRCSSCLTKLIAPATMDA